MMTDSANGVMIDHKTPRSERLYFACKSRLTSPAMMYLSRQIPQKKPFVISICTPRRGNARA